jgi:hypothetical protein
MNEMNLKTEEVRVFTHTHTHTHKWIHSNKMKTNLRKITAGQKKINIYFESFLCIYFCCCCYSY